MIRLFQFLLHGCFHVWEETGTDIYYDDFERQSFPVVYVRCKKCGRHTHFKQAAMKNTG